MIGDETEAGCLGSSAPDTASKYDVMVMRLGPVVLVAVLQIPPAMMRHWGW